MDNIDYQFKIYNSALYILNLLESEYITTADLIEKVIIRVLKNIDIIRVRKN